MGGRSTGERGKLEREGEGHREREERGGEGEPRGGYCGEGRHQEGGREMT